VNNLREIQALRRLSPHPNIIKLLEVLYDQPTGRLALVFELMDMNIYELIRGRRHYVAEERIKSYMYQLIKSMDHMHRNGIFHRDIKPENILIMDDTLKLADFGSCRGIYSKQPYTEYISTRWYRAPECLLTDGARRFAPAPARPCLVCVTQRLRMLIHAYEWGTPLHWVVCGRCSAALVV